MSSREDPRSVRSRVALQNALLELLAEKSLEEITVRDICARSGVHYTTFFRHHDSKESLLNQIAADQIRGLVELTLPVVESSDRHAVHIALCNYVDEHRALWKALLTGGAAATLKAELLRLCLKPAVKRVPKDSFVPVDLIVICTVSVVLETIAWWVAEPRGRTSVDQVGDILDEIVYSSIK